MNTIDTTRISDLGKKDGKAIAMKQKQANWNVNAATASGRHSSVSLIGIL